MHFYNHFEPSNFYKYSQFFTLSIPQILLDPERYLVPSLSRHNPAVYSAYQENIIYTITASQHVSAHTARLLILNASRTYCVCLSFGVRQSQTAGLMWRLAEGVVGPIGRVNFPLYMIHGLLLLRNVDFSLFTLDFIVQVLKLIILTPGNEDDLLRK